MYDIFLIQDLDLVEVSVRGELNGEAGATSVARALRGVADGSAVLVDLRGLRSVDDLNAVRLGVGLAELAQRDVKVACVADDAVVRERLIDHGLASHAMHDGVDTARQVLRRASLA